MHEFVNHHSALLILIALAGIVLLLAWGHRRSKRSLALIAVVTLVLSAGYMQARIDASDIESIASLDTILGGTPVVMEVFSNT